jgi:hypothetical protein
MSWTITGTIVDPDGTPADGAIVAIVSPTPARSSSGKLIDNDRVAIPVSGGQVGDIALESVPGASWAFLLPRGQRVEIADPGDGSVVNLAADLPAGRPLTPDEASLLRAEIARFRAEGLKGDKGDTPQITWEGTRIVVDGDPGPDIIEPVTNRAIRAEDAATRAASSAAAAQQSAANMVGPTDAGVAQLVQSGAKTSSALQQSFTRRSRTPLMLLDYAVGDGKADDTASVQQAFNDAIAQNRALYSPPGASYLCGPLTVGGPLRLEGNFAIKAATDGQAAMVNLNAQVDFSNARIVLNGNNLALDGVTGKNFGRSNLGQLETWRCRSWGLRFVASGNNNLVNATKFTARQCGVKYAAVSVTQTAATSNIVTSQGGYSTLSLGTPLPAYHQSTDTVQWVMYNGNAYKVKEITDASTIQVFNLDLSSVTSPTIDILAGGGLGLLKYGDSGVGSWGSLDLSANYGTGILANSMYGHTFNNAVLQANGIAVACSEYTYAITMVKPYFEANGVDIAMIGTIEDPLMEAITTKRVQYVAGRIGNVAAIPSLLIRKGAETAGGLTADNPSTTNPSARTITLGRAYAYYRTAGSWSFSCSSGAGPILAQYTSMMVLSHSSSTTAFPITITPTVSGETIEGAASWSSAVTGRCLVILSLVGSDWKVTIERDRAPSTTVSGAPVYVGQVAVVSGVVYIATGTSGPSDWKQVS